MGLERAHHKMASVPEGAVVEWPDDGNPWPLVSMRNVYTFAGNPIIFKSMFERGASDGRFEGARRWLSHTLWLDAEEVEVLDALQHTVDSFPLVEIGSYPVAPTADSRRRLSITFQSFDAEQLHAAHTQLAQALPASMLIDDDLDPASE